MTEPDWLPSARATLRAAIDGDDFGRATNFAKLAYDPDNSMAIVQAAFFWADSLLAAMPLIALWANMPADFSEHQAWVMRFLEARAGDNAEAARVLLVETLERDPDDFIDSLVTLLTLTAIVLRARESRERAFRN